MAPTGQRQVHLRVRLSAEREGRLVGWQLDALRAGLTKPTYSDLMTALIEFGEARGFRYSGPHTDRKSA